MRKKFKLKWIDISVPIFHGMISWPSDPPVEVSSYKSIKKGSHSSVSLLKFGSHVGTHMDAPRHFFINGETIDSLSLESLIGPARVIAIKDPVAITDSELKKYNITQGQRIILKTKNSSKQWWKKLFSKDFVYLTLNAAKYLAKQNVALLGVDSLSIGGYGEHRDGVKVHRVILGKGICVVEALNLLSVPPGWYDMICLPLRLEKSDGAPARVVLRKMAR